MVKKITENKRKVRFNNKTVRKPKTAKRKRLKKLDKSIVFAGIIGILFAVGLIIYYVFFDY